MNSFSGIAPFLIYHINNHTLIQQPQKGSFVKIMINQVLKDPACIEIWMAKLFQEEQAVHYFSGFVDGMRRELQNPILLSNHLEACVNQIKSKELPIVRTVFMHQPLVMGHLLLALGTDVRKSLIQQLIKIMTPSEWKNAFEKMLEEAKREDGLTYFQKRGRFVAFVEVLNRKQMRGLIRFCAGNLPEDCYAILLAALNPQWTKFGLNKFAEQGSLENFEGGYQVLIDALSQELPYDVKLEDILNHILNSYCNQNKLKHLTDHFKSLSAKSRVNMLSVMSYNQRKTVLAQECHNVLLLCNWLDELYERKGDYDERKDLFRVFYNRIVRENKNDFLQTLEAVDSQALLFMLVCLETKEIEDFLLNRSASGRTKLFSSFKMDSTTRDLIEEVSKNGMDDEEAPESIKTLLYSVMALDMTTELIDVDGGISVENCHEYLQLMANSVEDLEANYISFITKMPPFLVGIACSDPAYRATFLKLARHLTDEQLKFLVISIDGNQAYNIIHPLIAKLRTDQFKTILEAFSEEQLVDYADKRVFLLQETYADYKLKLNQLLCSLDKGIKDGKMISLAQYESYQKSTRELVSLGRTSFGFSVNRLMRYLETLGNRYPHPNTLESLKEIIEEYEARKGLLEGRASLVFSRLEAVEKLINPKERQEEYDPFTSLYEGFWSSLPKKVMEPVGIFPNSPTGVENLGQLQLVGIKTDCDLGYLLISKDRQVFIEKLSHKIRGLFTTLVPQTNEWEIVWNKLFNPAYSIKEANAFLEELLQFFNFDLPEKGNIKTFFIEICGELIKIDYLPFKQKRFLQKTLNKLSASSVPNLTPICTSLTAESLKIIRRRQTIFCLQYYLKQGKELKAAWEKFRELGCYTIEDLFKKKILTAQCQILKLPEAAEKLKM